MKMDLDERVAFHSIMLNKFNEFTTKMLTDATKLPGKMEGDDSDLLAGVVTALIAQSGIQIDILRS